MKLSGLLITKNNAITLDWALSSVVDYLDELVIIDDYSTDDTIKIAEKYGARVYKNRFVNFSEQRNYGIGKCNGEWIFTMDADEVMGVNVGKIRLYIEKKRYRSYLFPRYNLVHLNPDVIIRSPNHYSEWQPRVFRNDGNAFYENPVHHQLQNCRPRLKLPDINIFHLHYLMYDYKTRKKRVEYYESLAKGSGFPECYLFEDYPHTYSFCMEKIDDRLYKRILRELKMVNYEYYVDEKEQREFERKIKMKTLLTHFRSKILF